ncbi:hypothetical protein IQ270_00805 [Microcoleus sp. LEGE 07076]|uniref:hypothetical protein n=1 Tax=Microcoleus sp. LEGE 07076 TaxID=915322 RepID=UPI001880B76D|nr:hypothetical protein [Microcoleus sp. LEGE 07076]MBE9183299.1 hypothetical protein [Microcoleus sp. LEGE 07076]
MNYPDQKARELRHKKQEMRKRQQEFLLSELAAEIDRSVPAYLTSNYDEEQDSKPNSQIKQRRRKILAAAQFTGIVITVVITVRIASWLATALIVGVIALIAYKSFFAEED